MALSLLAATAACSSMSGFVSLTDGRDAAADGAAAVATEPRKSSATDLASAAAPSWLPGIAPTAGGNSGGEHGSDTGSEADVADQGMWMEPGAGATPRSTAPRNSIAAAPTRSPRASLPEEPTSSAPASPADADAFARRGDQLLQTGDVVGARLCYERAAAGGMAAAATRVGKTYDPIFLATVGVQGLQGDPSEAAAWYRRGISAGDPEALQRLSALSQMQVR